MRYDPVKNTLGSFVKRNTFLRKLFYKMLGLMFLREWYVKRKIKEIYKNNPPVHIFDAGCGFGQYSYFMAKHFPDSKILSVDVKEDQIEDCKFFFGKIRLNNCEFNVDDLLNTNFENKFNFILSVDVMEHIEEDVVVLKKFYKALK
ncbi:MAG: methyltransferase domain-containing protein, partial [Ignavibacteria bacterium]